MTILCMSYKILGRLEQFVNSDRLAQRASMSWDAESLVYRHNVDI